MNKKMKEVILKVANGVQKNYDDKRISEDSWRRLGRCQAWVTSVGAWEVLRSYDTIVAMYLRSNHGLYVLGRYSMTTYQHVRKFRNWIWEEYHPTEHPWDITEKNLESVNWFEGSR